LWKHESEQHRKAYEELVDFWGDVNCLTAIEPPSNTRTSAGGWGFNGWAIPVWGAALSLFVLAAWMLPFFNGPQSQVYTTQVGEQQTLLLPDQSTLVLNTDSQVTVSYERDRRVLTLQKGEAYFDVVKDPERPFEVYAGNGRVRAVGTAFTVRLQQQDVAVFVAEGVVEVLSQADLEPLTLQAQGEGGAVLAQVPEAVRVSAGAKAVYHQAEEQGVTVAPAQDLQKSLAWREGTLVFKGETLGEVIEEFSRYTDLSIVVPGKRLRNMKVGGIFKVGDTVALLDALENSFGIYAKHITDDIIYLVDEKDQ
ncbi:MAG: FecR domain-containing protein, partial [Sinobacterium sp.]